MSADSSIRAHAPLLTATVTVVSVMGLALAAGGIWLVGLGGSPYYLIAGVALLLTGWLLAIRHAAALWVYVALLMGTMIWSVWEVGLDFWSLAPRGDVLVPLGLWLLSPFIVSRRSGGWRTAQRSLAVVIAISFVLLAVSLSRDRFDVAGMLPTASAGAAIMTGEPAAKVDWTAYGGSGLGLRYSALSEINKDNVKDLVLAWQFETGDKKGPDDPDEFTNEVTPLKVDDLLYTCSPHQIVFALDAASGKLRWKFDPKIGHNKTFQHMTCRGVSYHETGAGALAADGSPAPSECPKRIFLPTDDGRLFALDAKTGKPCEGFGNHGQIDLKEGNEIKTLGFYEGTSPPVVTDKILIMGGAVIDNYSTRVPSGVIRGFDIYSGKLIWVFDAGNPDPNEMPSDTHQFTAGSPNSWTVAAVDEKLGLVYEPLGSSSPDIWAGHRTADQERYDSALVALDIATGKLRWSFQNVHHDLWDMDLPSQPSLIDLRNDAETVPAIYLPAKTGDIFVLDRRDGHLLVPAPEKPVPQGAAPGDHTSPTQPFSDLSFRPRQILTEAQMWGSTMFDQLICRVKFRRLRYEGPFTPPSEQGTLVYPGDFGMFEWGGIAVDPNRQIAIANPQSIPFVSRLVPRGKDNPSAPDSAHPPGTELGVQPMYGVPYGVDLGVFLSPLHIPCMAPPWGSLAALDLKTNKIIWRHRVGTIRDQAPLPLPFKLGVPMLGGPIVTAGGVSFLTGTMDDYIRAFDVDDGKLLWQDRLPAGGQSTPMTYEADGRQYVVTVDGGHGSFGTKLGDYVRAYALPRSR
ncbi:MAG TPA: glucose/quinate/shikimate family membrane-bound PQQ-dependent dehydrogenase [Bradyrhizobium sp.]|uniref:glucose/quinate/shikimate family membrane-bound PQQ-dependent dehydrogenase n=1 Tax=Bradyrhizobium sp. TaxID=376 RepID=UPI002D7E95D4|nr:glucose/quinate/shikimate family membrane-bound PQQ-dependent dehydrogenase [Bradyrhizobium sp.]HET7884998.1 glucose/quinate/shikimate family membrane-bound PQQ-dependent dehydrogenase [Bradyrhizobium sp.]